EIAFLNHSQRYKATHIIKTNDINSFRQYSVEIPLFIACSGLVTESFYINGDTLINGNRYYKQQKITVSTLPWPTPSGPSYIREDPTLKQYLYNPQTNTETVQYDWNQYLSLSVGSPFPSTSCTVTAIDSVLLGTRYLKRWHGPNSSGTSTNVATPAPSFIVEGIGEITDNICVTAIHSSYRVNCFLKQNNLLNFNLSSNCSNLNANGISENIINEKGLFIFPNPATDQLNLSFDAEGANLEKICIYNAIGQLVREEDINLKNKTGIINITDLPNGVYLLNLKSDKSGNVSKRFVIAR
ncbi:MAG: T9SS type A sorting domain-containing protein, partial [Bacteroidetes bacterium]|nr:T9SS type A sorting domain-containing protein [Bacteroidota bacterium]